MIKITSGATTAATGNQKQLYIQPKGNKEANRGWCTEKLMTSQRARGIDVKVEVEIGKQMKCQHCPKSKGLIRVSHKRLLIETGT
jgi:hypothetical protein